MINLELVVVPFPTFSHLAPMVHASKLLLSRHNHLSMTIVVINLPNSPIPSNILTSITNATLPRLRLIHIPADDRHSIPPQSPTFMFDYTDTRIEHIRKVVADLIEQPNYRLAGLMLDMFTMKFTQVAKEFELPSYLFYTSGAGSIGVALDLASLKFEHNQDLKQYMDSDIELPLRCFTQPLPGKLLPPMVCHDEIFRRVTDCVGRIYETNGVLINTFYEFEAYAIESLLEKYETPKVYPIGPILEANYGKGIRVSGDELEDEVMNWLDNQAERSVVFLCFGTNQGFEKIQVNEFAKALEHCGSKFVWSLRKPVHTGTERICVEYDNFEEVLPEGFLERTKGVGKVIGWAPQVAVLSHAAVGGFVSHCGWNSTLESVWFGVPMATMPMFAEQHTNAFQLVGELGIAEAIRMDYRVGKEVVPAEEIESAIRRVMAEEGVRGKVQQMQRKSREAVQEGGSSYKAQIQFLEDVVKTVGLDSIQ